MQDQNRSIGKKRIHSKKMQQFAWKGMHRIQQNEIYLITYLIYYFNYIVADVKRMTSKRVSAAKTLNLKADRQILIPIILLCHIDAIYLCLTVV